MLAIDLSPVGRAANLMRFPDAADLTPSGDFTFEFFDVIWNSVAAQTTLYSHYNATSNQRSLLLDWAPAGSGLRLSISTSGTSGTTTTLAYSWTPSTATPYQLCFERSGSTTRIYVDGTKVANGTVAGAAFNTNAEAYLGMGIQGTTFQFPFTGTCKAVRFTNGVARYATNGSYTVPTLPLPTS
jgi:hypothetical protein